MTEDNINIYCNEHKHILIKTDNAYHCMRTLTITDDLITKTKDRICKSMLLWRKLKTPVTSSANLFEDHIMYQLKILSVVWLIKRKIKSHQDGKRSERKYCGVTNYQQSQISQLKCNDLITNRIVKLKSKQIKIETTRKLKRKRQHIFSIKDK